MSDLRKFIKNKQDRQDPNKKSKRKFKKILIIIVIILFIAIGFKLYLNYHNYKEFKVVNTLKIDNVYNETQYMPFASNYLRYSNDGISYIDGSKIVWNQAFELKNPLIDICGEYAVIGDKNTNEIYLCDKEGLVNKLTTSYPVTDLEVASQGVVYALTDDNNVNYIEALDKDGEELVSGKTLLEGDDFGYPIDCSVSDDGQKLVVSFLYINSGAVETKVAFYNFSEVGQNEVNRLVGGFNYTSTIIPKVEFLNNDLVCAFGDNLFSFYSIKEKPNLKFKTEELFDNEIKSIFYNSKFIGLVFNNDDTNMPYIMHIYNTNGKEVLKREFSLNYTDIKFANNDILLYNNSSCEIYNISGVKKFEHTFDNGIVCMSGTSKSNRYIIASPNNVEEIKLK